MLKDKIKEKDKQLRDLMREKHEMTDCIEKLKRCNVNLTVKVRNHETIKEQYKSLNVLHSERESAITGLKQQIERQRLKSQTALNEANKKKLALIKTLSCCINEIKKYQPDFRGIVNIEDMDKQTEEEIGTYTKEIEQQLGKLTEDYFKLQEELRKSEKLEASVQADLRKAQEVIENQLEDIRGKNSCIECLEKVKEELQRRVVGLEDNVIRLDTKISCLEDDKKNLNCDLAKREGEISNLQNDLEERKNEIIDLKNKIDIQIR